MDIMEFGEKLVEFLGNVLGSNCEIVLQDVERGQIRAIANGHVSEREIGAPLTDLTMKMVASGEWKEKDYTCNYTGIKKDGKTLRSSSFFLKQENKLKGILCINIDDGQYKELSRQLLLLGGIMPESFEISEVPSSNSRMESFSESIHETVHEIVQKEMLHYQGVPVSRLKQEEKLAIIKKLNEKGVFLVKGAIAETAEELACSEASVYRYLSKINREK